MASTSRLVVAGAFQLVALVGLTAATVRLVRVVRGETQLAATASGLSPVGATILQLGFCSLAAAVCGACGFSWALGRSSQSVPDAESRNVVGMMLTAVVALAFGFLRITGLPPR